MEIFFKMSASTHFISHLKLLDSAKICVVSFNLQNEHMLNLLESMIGFFRSIYFEGVNEYESTNILSRHSLPGYTLETIEMVRK